MAAPNSSFFTITQQTMLKLNLSFCSPTSKDPYEGLTLVRRKSELKGKNGAVLASADVEVPSDWSQTATDLFYQKYTRKAGVPAATVMVPEPGIPVQYARRVPVDGTTFGAETSVRQVFHRIVGFWTYWGLKAGYFDADDATRFYLDHVYMLARQMASPNSPQWFNAGLNWAYGITGSASGRWAYDLEAKTFVECTDEYTRPNVGACLPYGERVNTDRGLIPIGEIVERFKAGEPISVFNRGGTYSPVQAAVCNGKKVIANLELADGSSLKLTYDHVVFVWDGDKIVEKSVQDLVPGDDELVLSRLPLVPDNGSTSHNGLINIDRELAWAAGSMVANGFADRNPAATSDTWEVKLNTRSQVDRFAAVVSKYGLTFTEKEFHWGWTLRGYGEAGRWLWERLGLYAKTGAKEIPEWVMRASRSVATGFLRGLWDNDGSVSGTNMEFFSVSRDVAEKTHALLRSLGVYAAISERVDERNDAERQTGYRVIVSDRKSRQLFAEHVGFTHDDKAGKLASVLDGERTERRRDAVKLVSKTRAGFVLVYDIQTESHEFFASGRLVHNCYILDVSDTLVGEDGITGFIEREARVFKGGSGSGANYSAIRGTDEPLSGGGRSSGLPSFLKPIDASAGAIKCLSGDTEVVTVRGLVPIRDVVAGDEVNTRHGFRRVTSRHDNGTKTVLTVTTSLGEQVVCTPEHKFWVRTGTGAAWVEAKDLQPSDYIECDVGGQAFGEPQRLDAVEIGHHNEITHQLPGTLTEDLAVWLGWVCGDGSVTTRTSANFVSVQIGDADPDLVPAYTSMLRGLFGSDMNVYESRHEDKPDASRGVRFASTQIIRFLEVNGLRKAGAKTVRVPTKIKMSPAGVRAAFLRGLFEADGHIEVRQGDVVLSTISEGLARDVQRLLTGLGVPSALRRNDNRAGAYGVNPVYMVQMLGAEGVRRYADVIGFMSARKRKLLSEAVVYKNVGPFEPRWFLPHVSKVLGTVWQRGSADVKRAVAPYCRYRAPRQLSLSAARRLVERFPLVFAGTEIESFARGDKLYVSVTVTPCDEPIPVYDITVDGVHEYLVHGMVTHNSGGTVRRAARMVVLDDDHPDIEWFVDWKVGEERKVAALMAGAKVVKFWVDQVYSAAATGHDREFVDDLMAAAAEHNVPYGVLLSAELAGRDKKPAPDIEQFTAAFEGEGYGTVSGQNANNSVRLSHAFMTAVKEDREWHLYHRTEKVAAAAAKRLPRPCKTLRAVDLWSKIVRAAWYSADPGVHFSGTINEWHTCLNDGEITASNPCSEYLFIKDTTCNLSCLNLTKYGPAVNESWDVGADRLRRAAALYTIALDITVTAAGYPSRAVAEGAHKYRTIGLGYTSLGAYCMREGLPYDSDGSRGLALALTALVHFQAALTSQQLASDVGGPYPRYEANSEHHGRVLGNHARFALGVPLEGVTVQPPPAPPMLEAVDDELRREVDRVARMVHSRRASPMRNAQLTLVMPAGTCGLVMDSDTLGVEPDFALYKYKTLSGGGHINIVNQSVEPALKKLGYGPEARAEIMRHVESTRGCIEGAPGLDPKHLPVFDTAVPPSGGTRSVSVSGHLRMMAAVQPLLSGAISKTVNMDRRAAEGDVADAYMTAYGLGIKANALYRDYSKLSQPLSAALKPKPKGEAPKVAGKPKGGQVVKPEALARGARRRLPDRRKGDTLKVRIGREKVYLRTGLYPDGSLGEIWIDAHKGGSSYREALRAFAVATSIGLQYGVPLEEFVDAFVFTNSEPNGPVQGHDRLKNATSVYDLIVRHLAIEFLGRSDLAHVTPDTDGTQNVTAAGAAAKTVPSGGTEDGYSGYRCLNCDSIRTRRSGTCIVCLVCGTTTGCA